MTDQYSISNFYTCTERIARVLEDHFKDITVQDMEPINNFVEKYIGHVKQEVEIKQKDHAVDSMYDLSPKKFLKVNADRIHFMLPVGPVGADDYLHREFKMHKKDYICFRTTKAGKIVHTNPLDQRRQPFVIQYHHAYFGNDKTYKSHRLLGASKQEIMDIANEAIHVTENYHHVFVEAIRFEETRDGVHYFSLVTGS